MSKEFVGFYIYGMEKLVTVVQFASQLCAYTSSFLSHTDCSQCCCMAITASKNFMSLQNVMAFLSSQCGSSSIAAFFIVLVALLWGSLFSVLS
jgi:hypothetical protein